MMLMGYCSRNKLPLIPSREKETMKIIKEAGVIVGSNKEE